jgi:hypothetical protein
VRRVHIPQLGHVRVPQVRLPIPDAVRSRVPDPANNRLLLYGGLAGLAAVGAIGWPVAGAVAAGSYIAEHRAKTKIHEESAQQIGGQMPAGASNAA